MSANFLPFVCYVVEVIVFCLALVVIFMEVIVFIFALLIAESNSHLCNGFWCLIL